ncbi:MAG: hypothetical protein PHT37_03430 [Candidatus Cloacimonetes bacterium]|nr:hypothetical protein [Candidatus Cloacimonadota bacterium]MDD2422956.1 hypothetical protein [Candidatus Cloacimonadota bacterium]MDD3563409.1 hypothetical protein [Candidatus Cloacimonadota bacterium]MDD4276925.1 hypothetical protein [Candidatus Cloacimonadota bacterium]MDY0324913.1 hypothetical protein [Candidatus Cloacimonadaceae bacterium]
MRNLILIIAMLGLLLCLSGKEILISPVEYRILEAQEYDLELTSSKNLGKMYATLRFDISKAELEKADHYSIFLACCAGIDRLKINGENAKYYVTTDLHPLHFVPVLRHLELIEADTPATCYSFDPDLFDQEINSVYIEYQFPTPAWQTRPDGSEVLRIGDIPFFYPRNIYSPAELSLSLHTTTFYTMRNADQITDKGSFRIIRKKIIDMIDDDIQLDLYKVLN